MTVCDGCNELFDGLSDYCPNCLQEMDDLELDCRKCGGSGEIEFDDDTCSLSDMIMCYVCNGSGAQK